MARDNGEANSTMRGLRLREKCDMRRYECALPGNRRALARTGAERSGASRAQVAWRCNVGICVVGKPGPIPVPALGAVVFFNAGDEPVGLLFTGLFCIYVCEFAASIGPDRPEAGRQGLRALGFFHLLTGVWLMYLMWAVTLDFIFGYSVPK
jgi:hypothetical protein